MKNVLGRIVLFLFCLPLLISCGDDDTGRLSIEEYVAQNNLTTQVTNSGLHYIIKSQGTAPNPSLSSNVTINYSGYLLDGSEFDSGNAVTFPLGGLIQGWQEGLQLIGSGGSITLLIPAGLAYGSRGSGPIAPNTPIGFEIDLISFE